MVVHTATASRSSVTVLMDAHFWFHSHRAVFSAGCPRRLSDRAFESTDSFSRRFVLADGPTQEGVQ